MEDNRNIDTKSNIQEGDKLEGLKGLNKYLSKEGEVNPFHFGAEDSKLQEKIDKYQESLLNSPLRDPLLGASTKALREVGTSSPEEAIGNDELGTSVYDRDILGREYTYGRELQDHRANTQTALAQLGAGTIKGVITAGTTFADGIGGTVSGLINIGLNSIFKEVDEEGNPVKRDYLNEFVDNIFSRSLQSINDISEEILPTYETAYQEDLIWWKKLDTAAFWGESFIKNLGFTVGAYFSGALKAGLSSKALRMFKSVRNAEKTLQQGLKKVYKIPRNTKSKIARQTTKGLIANTEGYVDDSIKLLKGIKSGKIDFVPDELVKQLTRDAKILNRAKWATQVTGVLAASGSEARIVAIGTMNEFRDDILSSMDEVKQSIYNEKSLELLEEIQNTGEVDKYFTSTENGYMPTKEGNALIEGRVSEIFDYAKAEKELNEKAINVGNLVFGLNIAILTISDSIQMGKYFSGDFAMKKQFKNSIKHLKPGQTVESLRGVKRRVIGDHLRNAFTEGAWEEMGQNMASELGKIKYGSDFNSLFDVEFLPGVQAESLDWMDAVGKAFSASYGNPEAWEEGFVGVLTGLIGMPRIRSFKGRSKVDNKSKFQSPFKFEGGIFGIRGQIQEQQQRLDESTQMIQNYVNSDEFRQVKSNMDILRGLDDYMKTSLEKGDKLSHDFADMAITFNTANMYQQSGLVQELYDRLDGIEKMSVDEIRETIDELYTDKDTGENPFKGLTDKDISNYISEKIKRERKTLDNYFKIDKALRRKFNKHIEQGLLTEQGLKELNFQLQGLSYWRDKSIELREHIQENLLKGKKYSELPQLIKNITYIDEAGNIKLDDSLSGEELSSPIYEKGFHTKNEEVINEAKEQLKENKKDYQNALKELEENSDKLDDQSRRAYENLVKEYEETSEGVSNYYESIGFTVGEDLLEVIKDYQKAVDNRNKFFDNWSSLRDNPEALIEMQNKAMKKAQDAIKEASVKALVETAKGLKSEKEFDEFVDDLNTDTVFNTSIVDAFLEEASKAGIPYARGYRTRKELKKDIKSKKSVVKNTLKRLFSNVKTKIEDFRDRVSNTQEFEKLLDKTDIEIEEKNQRDYIKKLIEGNLKEFSEKLDDSLKNVDGLSDILIDYISNVLNRISRSVHDKFKNREFVSDKEKYDALLKVAEYYKNLLNNRKKNKDFDFFKDETFTDTKEKKELTKALDSLVKGDESFLEKYNLSFNEIVTQALESVLDSLIDLYKSKRNYSPMLKSSIDKTKKFIKENTDKVVESISDEIISNMLSDPLRGPELLDKYNRDYIVDKYEDTIVDKVTEGLEYNLKGKELSNIFDRIEKKVKDSTKSLVKDRKGKDTKLSDKQIKSIVDQVMKPYKESFIKFLEDKVIPFKEGEGIIDGKKVAEYLDGDMFLTLEGKDDIDFLLGKTMSKLFSEVKDDIEKATKKLTGQEGLFDNRVYISIQNSVRNLIEDLAKQGKEFKKKKESKYPPHSDENSDVELDKAIPIPIEQDTEEGRKKNVVKPKNNPGTFEDQLRSKASQVEQSNEDQTKVQKNLQKSHIRPAMMEIDVNLALTQGNFKKYPEAHEKNKGYKELYSYLEKEGAFDYVDSGKLKEGDKLFLIIDKNYNKSVGESKAAVFIGKQDSSGNIQIVGNTVVSPYKVAEQHPQLKVALDNLQKKANSTDANIVKGDDVFSVNNVINGLLHLNRGKEFGKSDTVLRSEDLKGVEYELAVVNDGEIITSKTPKFELQHPSNIIGLNGRTILYIKGPNGIGVPTVLMTRNFGFDNKGKNIHNINILDNKSTRDFKKSSIFFKIKEGIKQLYDAQNDNDISNAFKMLSSSLYLSEVKLNIRDWKNGRGIFFFDGVANSKNSENGRNFIKTHEKTIQEDGEVITTKVPFSEFQKNFLSVLNHNNILVQVPLSIVDNKNLQSAYLDSGVFTTSINRNQDGKLDTRFRGSYFTMSPSEISKTEAPQLTKEAKKETKETKETKQPVVEAPKQVGKDVGTPVTLKDRRSTIEGMLKGDGSIEIQGNEYRLVDGELVDASGFKVTPKLLSRTLISNIKKVLKNTPDTKPVVKPDTVDDAQKVVDKDRIKPNEQTKATWARHSDQGYEVSTAGDSRFSALNARFKRGTKVLGIRVDNKTIEYVYQNIVKKSEKGKAPGKDSILHNEEIKDKDELEDFSYEKGYKPLWEKWADQNPDLIEELAVKSRGKVLTDKFANTRVSQARALADIINERGLYQKDELNDLIVKSKSEPKPGEEGSQVGNKVYGKKGFYFNLDTKQAFDKDGNIIPKFVWDANKPEGRDDLKVGHIDAMSISYRKITDSNYTQELLEREVEWLEKNIPGMDREGAIVLVESLINVGDKKAFGTYYNGIITLSRQGVVGTAYHEAFHAVFDTILSRGQQESLIQETGISDPTMATEWLAEKFREYMITGVQERTWKQKIKDFFKRLLDLIGITSKHYENYNEIFRRISDGYYMKQAQKNLTYSPTVKTKENNLLNNELESIKNSTKFVNQSEQTRQALEQIGYTQEIFDNMTYQEREQQLKCI